MTLAQFKKLKSKIEKRLEREEEKALDMGIEMSSDIFLKVKGELINKAGLTIEEYKVMEAELDLKEEEKEKKGHVLMRESDLKEEVAENIKPTQKNIKERQGSISKELTESKSEVKENIVSFKKDIDSFKQTVTKQISEIPEQIDYLPTINKVEKKVDSLKIPKDNTEQVNNIEWQIQKDKEEKEIAIKSVEKTLEQQNKRQKKRDNDFSKYFEKNIDIVSQAQKSMPDFRKLGMGLQGQIDEIKSEGVGAGIVENLSSQCDGSTTVFTTAKNITNLTWLSLNGTNLIETKDFTVSGNQITLSTVTPDTGEELYVKYV